MLEVITYKLNFRRQDSLQYRCIHSETAAFTVGKVCVQTGISQLTEEKVRRNKMWKKKSVCLYAGIINSAGQQGVSTVYSPQGLPEASPQVFGSPSEAQNTQYYRAFTGTLYSFPLHLKSFNFQIVLASGYQLCLRSTLHIMGLSIVHVVSTEETK